MKKSTAVQDEFAKSQPSTGNALEAPVRLTPEELETVAAGFAANFAPLSLRGGLGSTATTGLYPSAPPVSTSPLKMY